MPLNRNLNVPCGCARKVISGPKQQHLALAERGLDGGRAALEIVLAPRPALSAAAPSSRTTPPASRPCSVASGASSSAGLLSKNTSTFFSKPERQRVGVVHRHAAGSSRECRTSCRAAASPLPSAALPPGDRSPAGRGARRAPREPPMATMHAAGLRKRLELRNRLRDVTAPRCERYSSGMLVGRRLPPPPNAAAAAVASRGSPPSGKMSTSYFARRLPASSASG